MNAQCYRKYLYCISGTFPLTSQCHWTCNSKSVLRKENIWTLKPENAAFNLNGNKSESFFFFGKLCFWVSLVLCRMWYLQSFCSTQLSLCMKITALYTQQSRGWFPGGVQAGEALPETRKLLNKAKTTSVPSYWESCKEAQGRYKTTITCSKWVRGFSVRVSMALQVWEDFTISLLRIPESDLHLFCFLPKNIYPQEKTHWS
jgi:hypothetical protein